MWYDKYTEKGIFLLQGKISLSLRGNYFGRHEKILTKQQTGLAKTLDMAAEKAKCDLYIPTGVYRLHGVLEPASRKVRTTFTETEPMQI